MVKIESVEEETKNLYLNDKRPWIIGFSGGKDSTCVVQLVYNVLKNLPPDKRTKEVYILSSDTLVENPLMDIWRKRVCAKIETQAKRFISIILFLLFKIAFWVNINKLSYNN